MFRKGGKWYLNAVIAIGKVIHGLVLFVDDADAGLMGANSDGFDVFGRFPAFFKVGVDVFCGFDGGLRMKFGWRDVSWCIYKAGKGTCLDTRP